MADNKKVCPYCGSQQFQAYIKRGGVVESDGLDEEGNPKFKIIREGAKDNFIAELILCFNCGQKVTNKELVDGAVCKKCGKPVNANDLNENGVCSVCAMLEEEPNLANASPDVLLRLLAEARKMTNPVKAQIETKEEKAQVVEEKAAESDISNILDKASDTEKPAKKPRRPKAPKKTAPKENAENPKEEVPVPEENQEVPAEEMQNAQNEVAEEQNAPFPEINGMNEPEPVPADDGQLGFNMFDDEDNSQPF